VSERRVLEISAPEEPDLLRIEGREFAVRVGADLDTDVIAEILRFETDMRRFRGKLTGDRMADMVERAKRLVLRIVEMEDPEPEDFAWLKRHSMNLSLLTEILSFVMPRDGGATAEVAEALREDLPEATLNGDGEDQDPTRSQKHSRSRRSRSAKRSTSPPDTGEGSDGETSASTSRTRTAA
jgi:hypothetical protein